MNSSIRVFNEEVIVPAQADLGNAHFGSCSLYNIAQLEVCAKTLYVKDHSKLCYEANMLANVCHPNVSILVGICKAPRLLLMIFHGFDSKSFTLHSIIYNPSKDFKIAIQWTTIILHIIPGLQHIHSKHIIHNDLK